MRSCNNHNGDHCNWFVKHLFPMKIVFTIRQQFLCMYHFFQYSDHKIILKIEALHMTYDTVSMVDCPNAFKKSMITAPTLTSFTEWTTTRQGTLVQTLFVWRQSIYSCTAWAWEASWTTSVIHDVSGSTSIKILRAKGGGTIKINFQGSEETKPSKSHQFWPLCTGKWTFVLGFTQMGGGGGGRGKTQNFEANASSLALL